MTVFSLLVRAWGRIQNERNWTLYTVAKDARGRSVHPWDDKAECFCAVGAFMAEAHEAPPPVTERALALLRNAATELFEQPCITDVNDELGHPAVREMYAYAISAARREEERHGSKQGNKRNHG